ncbi:MAG TPA: chemotaxis protein CheW [Polyangiaceae bacterium]|jgi:purine-binding chemotaxis protein CheW|nr:chemotaxis protein CheW [Polyangiaceae bacterium]
MDISTESGLKMLLCRAGSLVCGLRIESVAETMRPLPIEPISGMPEFVSGLSIVRGAPVPVVDLARLLGDESDTQPGRFVVVKTDARRVVLAVSEVTGLRTLDAKSFGGLPPLLQGARADLVSAVGSLDAQLLLVLESGRVLPDSAWSKLRAAGVET